jgi:hypothetical protein
MLVIFSGLHDVISQKMEHLITFTVRMSNPTVHIFLKLWKTYIYNFDFVVNSIMKISIVALELGQIYIVMFMRRNWGKIHNYPRRLHSSKLSKLIPWWGWNLSAFYFVYMAFFAIYGRFSGYMNDCLALTGVLLEINECWYYWYCYRHLWMWLTISVSSSPQAVQWM